MQAICLELRWVIALGIAATLSAGRAQDPPPAPPTTIGGLAAENRELRSRVSALEQRIETLQAEMEAWRKAQGADADAVSSDPPGRIAPGPTGRSRSAAAAVPEPLVMRGAGGGRVVLSGELGAAYFNDGAEGAYPAGEFRVDDTKLYLDAEIRRGLYAFIEADVALRENVEEFRLGEAYLELENLGGLGGFATLRAGRIDIPFGEEYLARGMMENPLISHSLADFWGVDEGVEIFGGAGAWSYVLAAQNGSRPRFRDFTSDKSITVRVGFDPAPALHLGASVMRTGEIDAEKERFSELWWGGGFIRSIGDPGVSRFFEAELYQVDGAFRWRGGHLRAAAGAVRYEDDDAATDNRRTMWHAMVEGRQDLGGRLYAAGRYSLIDTGGGYPIAGHGEPGKYFFRRPLILTEDVWRLSLGLGYRVGPDFLLKLEYSFEEGTLIGGDRRSDMDRLSSQAAVRF